MTWAEMARRKWEDYLVGTDTAATNSFSDTEANLRLWELQCLTQYPDAPGAYVTAAEKLERDGIWGDFARAAVTTLRRVIGD